MEILDKIYGAIEVTEPVIVDIIHSKPMQRLKNINQYGVTVYLQPLFRTTTRYDHSIGAWYLSKKYGRSMEEQIASLLHDIPHTAFSHVADFVMQDANHEYHDKFLEKVLMHSEIPEILQNHNINVKEVLKKENYPLLDNRLPDISVDRWDYFLRDGYTFGIIPKEVVTLLFHSLKERGNVFYFEDTKVATLAAVLFLNCSRLIWLDPTSHGAFFLLSEAIKIAMKERLLAEEDLFGVDDEIMNKLTSFGNQEIDTLLGHLHSGKQFHYASKNEAEFYGPNKPRFIDPFVKVSDELKRVSDVVPGMNEYFQEFVTNHTTLGVSQNKE